MDREGVIRFVMRHEEGPPPSGAEIDRLITELIAVRRRCRALGLIGEDADGVGFGNLSRRIGDADRFIISGSGTGGLDRDAADLFTEVIACDIEANSLECRGPLPASSESLTHAAGYRLTPEIGAVIHAHHDRLWHRLRGALPTSRAEVPYGTPAMAREIGRLWREGGFREERIVVMGGHRGGLITVGGDLWECLERYEQLLG